MGRVVVNVLVAASVLWHTVVGCCAHHGHASVPVGTTTKSVGTTTKSVGTTTKSSIEPVRRATAACRHAHSHRKRTGCAKLQALKADHPLAPSSESCPHDAPSCDEPSCVFAVVKSVALPDFQPGATASLEKADNLDDAAARAHVVTAASAVGQLAVWWPESLRAHLFLRNLRN